MTYDPKGCRLGPGDGFVIIHATKHFTIEANITETVTSDPNMLADTGTYQALHGQGRVTGTADNRIPVWRVTGICAIFVAVTLFAVAARLREELHDIEKSMAPDRLIAACRRTPLEAIAPVLASAALLPPLCRGERRNILLVLGTRQLIRAAVVGTAVFGFFVVFGLVAVNQATAQQWMSSTGLVSFGPAMVKVAALLAGFSVMYFAVSSMTDSEFRQRYFAGILDSIGRVLAVRVVYRALLQHPGGQLPAPSGPAPDADATQPIAIRPVLGVTPPPAASIPATS